MSKRLTQRRAATERSSFVNIGRRSRALIAFTATAGVTFQATTLPPAIGEEQATVEAYLADLVGQVTDAEGQVTSLENELGGLREGANKARVDLATAQDDAQAAQNDVLSARDRLEASDKDVASAQDKLNEIARSAYAQGGDAAAVNLAAGGSDAVADTLDRNSYIQLATEKQRNEVERLDLARTQTANEESALRSSRSSADAALGSAVDAFKAAEEAVTTSQQKLSELQARYNELVQDRDKTEARLRAARSAVDTLANTKPNATSFEKRAAAETAVNKAEGTIDESAAEEKSEEPANNQAELQLQDDAQANEDVAAPQPTPAPADHVDAAADAAAETPSAQPGVTGWAAKDSDSKSSEGSDNETGSLGSSGSSDSSNSSQSSQSSSGSTGSSGSSAVSELKTSFDGSSSGDSQRQQAINGLMEAGEAAVLAGFTAYANGDESGALRAARDAGSEVAGQRYDEAMGGQTASQGTTQESTTGDSASQDSTSQDSTGQTSTNESTGDSTSTDSTDSTSESTSGQSQNSTDSDDESDDSTTDSTGTTPSKGTSSGTADNSVDTTGSASEKIERVIARAESQTGVTYAWGGGDTNGPTQGIRDGGTADSYGDYNKIGFDCSGLMMYAFAAAGISLQHYSGYQYTAGRQVPVSEAKRGDMLFWGAGGSQHVALYLGDGQMIEAKQSGTNVMTSPVRWSGIQPMAVRMIE